MADLSAVDPDLIAIQDAAKEFNVSYSFFYDHSYGDGETATPKRPLRRVRVPGDKRSFLRRSQVSVYMRPSDAN